MADEKILEQAEETVEEKVEEVVEETVEEVAEEATEEVVEEVVEETAEEAVEEAVEESPVEEVKEAIEEVVETVKKKTGKVARGFGITTGILGLLTSLTVIGGVVFGILSLIFGGVSKKRCGKGGGIIAMGIISLVIAIAVVALMIWLGAEVIEQLEAQGFNVEAIEF